MENEFEKDIQADEPVPFEQPQEQPVFTCSISY